MRIAEAIWPFDTETVVALFREYSESIDADICFQGFEQELASLPGKYASPLGCVLLAYSEDVLVGCAALRPLTEATCEMKRVYVRPNFRGLGWGRTLALALIERAATAGYQSMRLDTLATMVAAQKMYLSLGFKPSDSYYNNPLPGTIYMELENLARIREQIRATNANDMT